MRQVPPSTLENILYYALCYDRINTHKIIVRVALFEPETAVWWAFHKQLLLHHDLFSLSVLGRINNVQ